MQKPSFDSASAVDAILNGDIRSTSRLLTLIERRHPSALPALKKLYPYTGKAKLLGVTGPAGVGKSTLIDQLIFAFRKRNQSVGVLAVDPTSPFTGGAILGDRVRMHRHFLDKGVFIRSLATQGMWGGISPALFDAIHVLDAMGKEIILIETIGVGQDEVQIARLAEMVLLVLAPGMGDEIQTMKAGLLEIGDIVAVNKGDLKESDLLLEQLREIEPNRPITKISAEKRLGINLLVTLIRKGLQKSHTKRSKRKALVREELRSLLQERLMASEGVISFTEKSVDAILLRKENPYTLIDAWAKKRGIKM